MICGNNYNNSNTCTKKKKKLFTNVKYIAICFSYEVGCESISVSSSVLHPSVTCVTKDTSNMMQSNIQYVVIEIVTVYMIWYDMIWYGMVWYDIWYMIWYDIWYIGVWYDMIYGMIWYDITWFVSVYLKFFTFLKNLLYLCYNFLLIVVKTHELFCLFCVHVWINIFISSDLEINQSIYFHPVNHYKWCWIRHCSYHIIIEYTVLVLPSWYNILFGILQ